jgi:polyhydroxyalkanoate synthase
MMWRRGVLAGSQMRGTFHLMRSNALIWSRVVRQYLMGEQAEITAMSAWAADSTRMPYRMHSDYLRSLYLNNDLAEGRFRVGDRPVAIQDIRIPIFALGTEWDNVAPWRSVYKLNALADTEVTFVLASRGHNQGVVAPPGVRGRHYRMATRRESDIHRDADGWIAAVPEQQGSWWPAWFGWLEGHSSGRVAAPPMGRPEAGYAVIEPAPGSYVTSP